MRSYSIALLGPYTRTTKSGASYTIEYLQQNAVLRRLTTSPNNGDFRNPTSQSFDRTEQWRLLGSYNSKNLSTGNFTLMEGYLYNSDPSDWDQSYSSIAYNSALSKLYEKVRGEIDISIDLFEYRQAADMITKFSLRGLSNLHETVIKMRRSPAKAAARLWLEFTYGWKPLASSIYGAMELFKNGPKTGLIKVSSASREQSYRVISWNAIANSLLPARTVEHSSKRCRFECWFNIHPSIIQNLASMSSLNPVSIAWELVPYSFVIDWVLDVGGYLRNIESALLYRTAFVKGYYTQGVLITGDTVVSGDVVSGGFEYSASLKGSYRVSRKNRVVITSSPFPRPPRFHVDLGWQRLLSAASLLRQRLG